MTRRLQGGHYEYRVRYRRKHGKEKGRIFGRLPAARRFLERIKNYESDDPLFPAEPLLYAEIDRRLVPGWSDFEDPRR